MHLMTVTLCGAALLFSPLGLIHGSRDFLFPLDSGFEFPRRLAPVIRKASARCAGDTRVIFVEVKKKKKPATSQVTLSPPILNAPHPPPAAVTRERTCEAGRCLCVCGKWWSCLAGCVQGSKSAPTLPSLPRQRVTSHSNEQRGRPGIPARPIGWARLPRQPPRQSRLLVSPSTQSSSVASQAPSLPPRSLPQLSSQMGCAQTGEMAHEYLWAGISLLLLLLLLLAPPPSHPPNPSPSAPPP